MNRILARLPYLISIKLLKMTQLSTISHLFFSYMVGEASGARKTKDTDNFHGRR
jgi:hypothetical protein